MPFDKTKNAKRYQQEARIVTYVHPADKDALVHSAKRRGIALSRLVDEILNEWLRVAGL